MSATCSTPRKRRFATRQAAEVSAHRAIARSGRVLRAYECPGCGWWHLTKDKAAPVGAPETAAR